MRLFLRDGVLWFVVTSSSLPSSSSRILYLNLAPTVMIVGGLVDWTSIRTSLSYLLVLSVVLVFLLIHTSDITSTGRLLRMCPTRLRIARRRSDPQSRAYSIVGSHVVLNIKRLLEQHDDEDTTDGGVSAGGPITFNVRRSTPGVTMTNVSQTGGPPPRPPCACINPISVQDHGTDYSCKFALAASSSTVSSDYMSWNQFHNVSWPGCFAEIS